MIKLVPIVCIHKATFQLKIDIQMDYMLTALCSMKSWIYKHLQNIRILFLQASPFRYELLPIHQVENKDTNYLENKFSCSKVSASINLTWKSQRPLLAARYILTIDFPNGWRSLSLPILYFDGGEGFNNQACKELHFTNGSKKTATTMVSLPGGMQSISFDSKTTPYDISIGEVTLNRIPTSIYYSSLAAKLARNQLTTPRQLFRSVLCVLRTHLRHGADGLARRFDQQGERLAQEDYAHWVAEYDILNTADRSLISQHLKSLPIIPITVIWSLRDDELEHIASAIESLKYQLHNNWKAIIIVPTASHLAVARTAAKDDERICVITAAEQLDIQSMQTTNATLLVAGKVLLRDHALYLFAIEAFKGATFVYSDEDLLMDSGHRAKPFFKPNYSPELARNTPYFGSCILVQQVTLDVLSEMKDAVLGNIEFAQIIERLLPYVFNNVAHIPFVLFSDNERCARANPQDRELPISTHPLPKVSIIIPTRDREDLLRPCIESILKKTDYPRDQFEIIVVDNGSSQHRALNYLKHIENQFDVIILRDAGEFNYSRLNNRAAQVATGDILVFLNNDTVIIDTLWLKRLTYHAQVPDIGVVGGKLLYPDGTVQHGGVVMGIGGGAAHAHIGNRDGGYENLCNITHEVSAVTAACCAIRRSIFFEIGGFDENLAVAYNDVLLCIDARHRGYRNIYIGTALIIHFESKSRGYENTPEKYARLQNEMSYLSRKYPDVYKNDNYYNPNLSATKPYKFAFPPRKIKPWREFSRKKTRKLYVLILFSTHEISKDVSKTIEDQVLHLINAGHKVAIGGPFDNSEHTYENCKRLKVYNSFEAAEVAYKLNIDCVVSHTQLFYSTARWLGPHIKTVIVEHKFFAKKNFSDKKKLRVNIDNERSFNVTDYLYKIPKLDAENIERKNFDDADGDIVNIIENLCLK